MNPNAMPQDIEKKVRQFRGLYANRYLTARLHFAGTVHSHDAWLRMHPDSVAGVELCRLCGRNDVPLIDPWTLRPFVQADLLQADVVGREAGARIRRLLGIDLMAPVRFVGHAGHFDVALVPKRSTYWRISPRVCVEDFCWFFHYHSIPRFGRGHPGKRREMECAVSWPSLFGFWLSSRDPCTVRLLWGLLPPELRRNWKIVNEWIHKQVGLGKMEAPLESSKQCVRPMHRAEVRSIPAVHQKLRQQANTRCSVCCMSLFPEEVAGVQVLRTAEFEWVNHGSPGALQKRSKGVFPAPPDKGLFFCEGWQEPWRTFYGFVIWTRVWFSEGRGLVVSVCFFCPEHPDLWHFITPKPPRELFLPPHEVLYGEFDEGDPWLQPANGVDLGFLGVVRLVDMTLKASRVCYHGGDPDRPGNLVFRVLKVRGDSRGVSASFFSMMPRAPDVSGRFAILGPSRRGWIARTVYTRPDLTAWWKELRDKGVLDEAYTIGPDQAVGHREAQRLKEAAERRRKQEEFLSGQRAVPRAAAAVLGKNTGECPSTREAPKREKTEDGSFEIPDLETRDRVPVALHRDKDTSYMNSLLQLVFAVPDAVRCIMTRRPLDASDETMDDSVSLELQRALQEVLALVLLQKLPTKKEYGALRRAFLQACVEWKLNGVKLADGPVRTTSWHVDDTKIDAPAVWNMFANECLPRIATVVVKAEERCCRCDNVRPAVGVVDGCVWPLVHPGTSAPSIGELLCHAIRSYGSSEQCPTAGCGTFNPLRRVYETSPHVGKPRVEVLSPLLAVSIRPPQELNEKDKDKRCVWRVRLMGSLELSLDGEDQSMQYELRGYVEHVAEEQCWAATLRVWNRNRWYRCVDRDICEVKHPSVAAPVLVVYERTSSVETTPMSSSPRSSASPTATLEVESIGLAPEPELSSDTFSKKLSRPAMAVEVEGRATVKEKVSFVASEHTPRGLCNVGNTCYLNSLVQCVLACATLRNSFLALHHVPPALCDAIRELVMVTHAGSEISVALLDKVQNCMFGDVYCDEELLNAICELVSLKNSGVEIAFVLRDKLTWKLGCNAWRGHSRSSVIA